MTIQQKTEIQSLLNDYVAGFATATAAAGQLEGVSHATIIQIRDGKWQSISDAMWRNVGKQVGWTASAKRKATVVPTRDFKTLTYYFNLAKAEGETFSITGGSGYGKTFTGKHYAAENKGRNVYYLECNELWKVRDFLIELIKAMGKSHMGMTMYEMMDFIIAEMRRQDNPLIILDEVDKLDDKALRFFITIYNKLNGLCGIVWTATANIERRLLRGMRLGKTGYEEIWTRIGANHIQLQGTNYEEVTAICHANGITDPETINQLFNTYQGNLRRVDRVILKEKVKQFNA